MVVAVLGLFLFWVWSRPLGSPSRTSSSEKICNVTVLNTLERETSLIFERATLLERAFNSTDRGVRILSIDGGGIRGIMALKWLSELEHYTGKRTYEMFDFIAGTSTGGIIATALSLRQMAADDVADIYDSLCTQIFPKTWTPVHLLS
jgi:hypothetical protein